MSSPMNLPPLPEPHVGQSYHCNKCGYLGPRDHEAHSSCQYTAVSIAGPCWTADQMRAYGEACAASEREAWNDAISDALQSDLEHGVKWLNERASVEFNAKYPALSKAIRARGETN